ncbi:MAG: FkbM family methyltransferase [Xanthomonadales bacterium]|nr:FkbM family methyltransferase [Xanthomonadales bacterium]
MNEHHEANGALFIAEDDMIVRWERAERKKFEPETTNWLFNELRQRSGTFVDVGAGTGWFSIPVRQGGHAVIAFEPNPAVRKRLRENMRLNGVKFAVVSAAASAERGVATFYHNPRVPLTSGGSIQAPTCHAPQTLAVQKVTIDETCADCDVAMIKIDVEGHEMSVLAGAAETIRRCRPFLMLEANTAKHRTELDGWLKANGYVWRQADERNMLCAPAS